MPASLPAIVGAMVRFTIRLDEDLAADVRLAATEARRSVNGWVVAALQAAVDPQLAESSAERTRGRLGRAGLLTSPPPASIAPPDPRRLARARRAAGKGTPLSEIVADDR